jgi:hypothetical protein
MVKREPITPKNRMVKEILLALLLFNLLYKKCNIKKRIKNTENITRNPK